VGEVGKVLGQQERNETENKNKMCGKVKKPREVTLPSLQ